MKKLLEIDFIDRYKDFSKSQLNKELISLCQIVMKNYPKSYESKLKSNEKHKALITLIKKV